MVPKTERINHHAEPNKEISGPQRRRLHNVGADADLMLRGDLRQLLILDSIFRYDHATEGPIYQRALEEGSYPQTPLPIGVVLLRAGSDYRQTIRESAEQLYHPASVAFLEEIRKYSLGALIRCLRHFHRWEAEPLDHP